jgi:hypothetical protein
MSSVEPLLRSQAEGMSIFTANLIGAFPAPFVIGAVIYGSNYYWGTFLAAMWVLLATIFSGLAFNISVSLI